MKTVCVFLCVVATVLANNLPNLPENERIKLRNVHQSCQSNPRTYCNEDKLRNLLNNVDDDETGVHMLCMAVKAGLMRKNGDFDLESMKNKVSLVIRDKSRVSALVHKCAQRSGNSGKTANLMWICFVQNDIQYYHQL